MHASISRSRWTNKETKGLLDVARVRVRVRSRWTNKERKDLLDVPVDHVDVVHVLERRGDLAEDHRGLLLR